jgi:hypothetical protein
VVREALEPARIVALDSKTMRVDLNHTFARFPVQVQCKLNRVLPGSDRRGGRCMSPLDDLVRYPGLAAPLPDGSPTDFGDSANGVLRMDEREDSVFYTNPRMVQHLDARTLPDATLFHDYQLQRTRCFRLKDGCAQEQD